MTQPTLSLDVARKIGAILVDAKVLHARYVDDFVRAQTEGCTEYRIGGADLGGGKFWNNNGKVFVEGYAEYSTPERRVIESRINDRIRVALEEPPEHGPVDDVQLEALRRYYQDDDAGSPSSYAPFRHHGVAVRALIARIDQLKAECVAAVATERTECLEMARGLVTDERFACLQIAQAYYDGGACENVARSIAAVIAARET